MDQRVILCYESAEARNTFENNRICLEIEKQYRVLTEQEKICEKDHRLSEHPDGPREYHCQKLFRRGSTWLRRA